MDCGTFFEDLRERHLENGIPFDHLHNRMVLSADKHIAIPRYIRKRG